MDNIVCSCEFFVTLTKFDNFQGTIPLFSTLRIPKAKITTIYNIERENTDCHFIVRI